MEHIRASSVTWYHFYKVLTLLCEQTLSPVTSGLRLAKDVAFVKKRKKRVDPPERTNTWENQRVLSDV